MAIGNLIFSNSFRTYTATSAIEDTDYPASNMADQIQLKRHARTTNATKDQLLWKLNLGASLSVVGAWIHDTNLDKVTWRKSTNGTDWTTISTASISIDAKTERRKIFTVFSGVTDNYIGIYAPADVGDAADPAGAWRVGTVVLFSSLTTLTKNASFPLKRSAFAQFVDAGGERHSIDNNLIATLELTFKTRHIDNEAELWTVNAMGIGSPIFLYENRDNTAHSYLCYRDDAFEISWDAPVQISGNSIKFREIGFNLVER
jgi:hypothetical protein